MEKKKKKTTGPTAQWLINQPLKVVQTLITKDKLSHTQETNLTGLFHFIEIALKFYVEVSYTIFQIGIIGMKE